MVSWEDRRGGNALLEVWRDQHVVQRLERRLSMPDRPHLDGFVVVNWC